MRPGLYWRERVSDLKEYTTDFLPVSNQVFDPDVLWPCIAFWISLTFMIIAMHVFENTLSLSGCVHCSGPPWEGYGENIL